MRVSFLSLPVSASSPTRLPLKSRKFDGDSPLDFIISMNLKRRHLSVGQKAMIGVDVEREYSKLVPKGRPKKSGKHSGLSGESRKHAAKQLGINEHYITDAKDIKKKSPELAKKVRSGKMTLSKAKRQVKREEDCKKAARHCRGVAVAISEVYDRQAFVLKSVALSVAIGFNAASAPLRPAVGAWRFRKPEFRILTTES